MRFLISGGNHRLLFSFSLIFVILSTAYFSRPAAAQGSANNIGNGGKHTIQGRLYLADGKRGKLVGIMIRLLNYSAGELSAVADGTGTFIFKNLSPGSYYVVIDGGELFENVRENVVIDDPGSTAMSGLRLTNAARIANVQIYLKPKDSEPNVPPGVLNADLEKAPKNARTLYVKAKASENAGDLKSALEQLNKALEIFPEFELAYTELGLIYGKLGQLDNAIAAFLNAIKLDPNSFNARLNLGVAFLNQKRLPQAEEQFVAAAYIDRGAVTPHYYIGLASIEKNDLATARAALEKARELIGAKPFPMLHKYLGGVYMAIGKWSEAAAELELYLQQSPEAKDAVRIRSTIAELKTKSS